MAPQRSELSDKILHNNKILQLNLLSTTQVDLTRTRHNAQRPHEVSTPFHFSHQMILPSLSTGKNPLKTPQKESNCLSATTFSGKNVKKPLFLDFTMQVQLVKITPETWKWLSLLVDSGQVPPPGKTIDYEFQAKIVLKCNSYWAKTHLYIFVIVLVNK